MGRPRSLALATVVVVGSVLTAGPRPAPAFTGRSFTVVATGDVLVEATVWQAGARFARGTAQRYDFRPMFAPTAPIVAGADLAICHMETPVGVPGARPGRYGRTVYGGNKLLAPYEIVPALAAAGFDRCSTASNHSYDLGPAGIGTTLDALDAFGIAHTGTARTPAEAVAQLFDVHGVRVAHLSYTRRNNSPRPRDRWRLDLADRTVIHDEVLRLRAAGAEVVLLSLHQGTELRRSPTSEQRRWLRALLADTPIDVVISHHAHVVQPVEVVGTTLVYWGLGNFLSGMGPGQRHDKYAAAATADGLLARFDVVETSPGTFSVTSRPVAVCSARADRVVYAASTTLADPTIPKALRKELTACLARTRKVVPSAA